MFEPVPTPSLEPPRQVRPAPRHLPGAARLCPHVGVGRRKPWHTHPSGGTTPASAGREHPPARRTPHQRRPHGPDRSPPAPALSAHGAHVAPVVYLPETPPKRRTGSQIFFKAGCFEPAAQFTEGPVKAATRDAQFDGDLRRRLWTAASTTSWQHAILRVPCNWPHFPRWTPTQTRPSKRPRRSSSSTAPRWF